MPYTPTTPESANRPQVTQVSVDLDTYRITSIKIDMDPNDSTKTTIGCTLVQGVTEGNGTFTSVKSEFIVMSGNDVLTKMVEATNDGETIYDAVKRGIYELLQGRGDVPAGTIV